MLILISLSLNLEKQVKNLTEISNQMRENIILENNILKELIFNIEYAKNQSNDVIKIIGEMKIVSLGQNILIKLDARYREIKQFLTELKQTVTT